MSEPRSIAEAYLSATSSSNLRVEADRPSDADRLLAAAYASMGDPRRNLALRVWRIRATGDMAGAHALAEDLGALLRTRSIQAAQKQQRRNGPLRQRGHLALTSGQAKGVSLAILKWWQHPSCPMCDGHGHPKMLGAPVLDTTRECPECRGTGSLPLERYVRAEYMDAASWMVGQMESLSAVIWDDMARRMKREMDF